MFGVQQKCPKCNKSVYAAEEVLANSKKYHKACFRCASCRKGLDSTNLTEKGNEIYCKACYGKNFGPTGYGYGQGAGTLANTGITKQSAPPMANSKGASANFCGNCGNAVGGAKFCSSCGTPAASSSAPPAPKRPVEQKQQQSSYVNRPAFGARKMNIGNSGGSKCPRCGKSVYAAEQVLANSSKYHKSCFRCASCKKGLDATTLADKDGEIYCRSCHSKNFGPKGYGYGQGAGALANTK